MSDLAPLVAAALRDKTVTDLLEENERLRTFLHGAFRVQLTGTNGTPVWTSASLAQGFATGGNTGFAVALDTEDHEKQDEPAAETQAMTTTRGVAIPLSQLRHLEVWLGGNRCATLADGSFSSHTQLYEDDFDLNDDTPQMAGLLLFVASPVVQLGLYCRFGPVTKHDYLQFPSHCPDGQTALDALHALGLLASGFVVVTQVQFRKSDIAGTLSLLQMCCGVEIEQEEEGSDFCALARIVALRQQVEGVDYDETTLRELFGDNYDAWLNEHQQQERDEGWWQHYDFGQDDSNSSRSEEAEEDDGGDDDDDRIILSPGARNGVRRA